VHGENLHIIASNPQREIGVICHANNCMTITMRRYPVYQIDQSVLRPADHQVVYDVRYERRLPCSSLAISVAGHQ